MSGLIGHRCTVYDSRLISLDDIMNCTIKQSVMFIDILAQFKTNFTGNNFASLIGQWIIAPINQTRFTHDVVSVIDNEIGLSESNTVLN